eukprot:TRINITY_DN12135_c2_g2_i1.p1 TRINITY_DN12135_c2_g2~~TRINITY_DN12135_c2_g2_i1.p1  ORF type:complete len:497 (+),score=82.10 TRINITY_DN12135_c2_g2_i1:179-1492(+)
MELNKVQFRKLWSVIQGTLNREQQGDLDDLFDTLDVNGDDSLSMEEVQKFLVTKNLSELPPCDTLVQKIRVLAMEHDSDALDIKKTSSPTARDMIFAIFVYKIVMLIASVLSVVLLIIDAHPDYYTDASVSGTDFTRVMDGFVVTLFTLDVVMKAIAWEPLFRLGIVTDIACVLPFYVTLIRGTNDDLQALRSFRIFYVLKVPTYTRVFHIGKNRIPPLHIAVLKGFKQFCKAFSVLCCLLSISSACMFFAELHDASYDVSVKKWRRLADSGSPDAGELIQFQSIPDAMWWSMVTMTTVGYGDYIPVTSAGKVVAGITMLCGLIFVGFVSNTLTGAFAESQITSTVAARNEALRLKFRSALLRIEHKGLENFHNEEEEQIPPWVDDFKRMVLQQMSTLHDRIIELEAKLADKENTNKGHDDPFENVARLNTSDRPSS